MSRLPSCTSADVIRVLERAGWQYVALDQGYVSEQDFEALVEQAERTSQLVAGLIRYLQRRTPNVKRQT